MPTGPNQPVILNQAAINAAIAQQRAAQQRVTAAEKAKQEFAQRSTPTITKSISDLSAGIKGFTEALKTGEGVGKAGKSARQTMQTGKETRTALQTELTPLETEITTAQNILSGITVPGAIYGPTGSFSQTQSAYDLLFEQFSQYGLGALIEPLKQFIVEGISPAELTLRLRDTDAYKKRFAANQQRINKGLRALSEAEYINLEDQYQNVMRQYGLPASYYTRGDMGRQEGFEKFISGDVSAAELEDRIQTAQTRVVNAAPEIAASLRSYYPDISNGDILAYALDPEKAITEIRRKVTAAEIGAGATMAGLTAGRTRAEELAAFGVTGEQARQGFRAVAEVAPRGGQLAEFYRQTPYTQTTAEQEVFGLTGAAEAGRQRRKLTELEQATFAGSAGAAGGALARDRAGAF